MLPELCSDQTQTLPGANWEFAPGKLPGHFRRVFRKRLRKFNVHKGIFFWWFREFDVILRSEKQITILKQIQNNETIKQTVRAEERDA